MGDLLWYLLLGGVALLASWRIYQFLAVQLTLSEILHVLLLGLATALRVMVCILLAAIIWVPIGVHIGLRPRLAQFFQPVAQFLAAFPANLLFPPAVIIILRYQLDPNVWLTPLMILGTQWYLLFNVIAGASAFPQNLRDAAAEFHVRGWLWWRKVMMPSLAPYLLTGAITAAGGCWNASIVAEAVSWGDDRIGAFGLGAYIADATLAGDFAKIALGIGVMSLYVALSNRLIWRPLYALAEKRAQLR
jgi:NitT/TauT family transport system permease protein